MKTLEAVLYPIPPGLRHAYFHPGQHGPGVKQEVIPPHAVRRVTAERQDNPRFEPRRFETRSPQRRTKPSAQAPKMATAVRLFAEDAEAPGDFRPRPFPARGSAVESPAASPRVRAALVAYHTAYSAGLGEIFPGEYFDFAV